MRKLLVLLILISTATFGQNPTSSLWTDYVDFKNAGEKPILPDYSFSGYHFSEKEVPDVASWEYFDVTDYGATADDETYDDAGIQAAIDAAEASTSPAVVFFPPGRFIVSNDNDIGKSIQINGSHLVLKGSGTGPDGTEIHMDKMRVQNGHWQFVFQPESSSTGTLAALTQPASRDDFTVTVNSTSNLSVGQSIHLRHQSEEFARAHFGELELAPEWTRLYGEDGGMNLYECHIISEIDGNEVTFKNPIQTDLPTLSEPYQVRNLKTIEEVGIEDILFTSAWEDYPEEFVHHKDDIHDYAWSAVRFKFVKNGWIRNCEFRHWNEGIDVRECIGLTIENVLMSGKRGHASFLTRRSYGVLVKDCVDEANHHHGPGFGYQGVSTVYLRHTMQENQSIDSHSGQPYCSLLDDVDGGDFHSNGGPHESYPHHGRFMTFWNFVHKKSSDEFYDFWVTDARRPATYAEPIFVGFQPTKDVNMVDVLMDEYRGQEVFPKSLFEAQLDYRLNPEKYQTPPVTLDVIDDQIRVYPNPFQNELKLDAQEIVERIHLFDSNGKTIPFSAKSTFGGVILHTENLPTGIYFMTAHTKRGSKTYQVVKDRNN